MKALVTLTMFTGAALLFLIQPMFGKMILPIFGGAPAVWITSVVFFQVMLLAGYLYSHVITKRLAPRAQTMLHAVVMLIALAALPVRVRGGWGMISPLHPVLSVFLVLLSSIGLPFFVVSTTAPLLQRWFGSTAHSRARDPFFLYAASNIGSIGALLAYPILVEPYLRLGQQTVIWSIGYVILVLLIIACAVRVRASQSPVREESPPIPWRTRLRWVALAAVPSSLMLSVTSHITTDIAPVPLLWIIPLALYLGTFVVVFSPRTAGAAGVASRVLPFAVLIPLVTLASRMLEPPVFMVFHLLAFTLAALACHGELAANRPGVDRLTEFYVLMAIGGALGGLFNVIVAPLVFRTYIEYPLGLILACFLRPQETKPRVRDAILAAALAALVVALGFVVRLLGVPWASLAFMVYVFALPAIIAFVLSRRAFGFASALTGIAIGGAFIRDSSQSLIASERSFYGVHRIVNRGSHRVLMNGNTHHGAQSLRAPRRCVPLSYYYPTGPLGQVFTGIIDRRPRGNIAVIGLGTGSTGGYARPDQQWTFYEIDPSIERIARDPRYFTFLRDCVPQGKVVLGDGRIELAAEPGSAHDLIVVDAFSSDAIPVHLLTREAMMLYVSKLAPHGVLAFHISNRYVNLRRVLGRLASDAKLIAYVEEDRSVRPLESYDGKLPSVWVVMARSDDDFGSLTLDRRWLRFPPDVSGRAWTDDYSNVLETLKLRL